MSSTSVINYRRVGGGGVGRGANNPGTYQIDKPLPACVHSNGRGLLRLISPAAAAAATAETVAEEVVE